MKECLSTVQRTLEFSSVLAKISASSMAGSSFRLFHLDWLRKL